MKQSTATEIVSQYTPPRPQRAEAAGPCMAAGCGGQLELRHERTYGRVYAVCPACERRVLEVRQLRDNIARLKALVENLRQPGKTALARQAVADRRAARLARNADIVRRYQAGESGEAIATSLGLTAQGVYFILGRSGIARRPRSVAPRARRGEMAS